MIVSTEIYRPRSINGVRRDRRTKVEMESVKAAIPALLEAEQPMTVRQVFYRLVAQGLIDKTENEYKQTVVRLLTELRLDGTIPFEWIADNSRWMRKPRTFDSLDAALRFTKDTYRRALWANQPAYVEIWLEKEALAGVIYQDTREYDVPLMVTRGYASLSFLYEAAQVIEGQEKPVFVYLLSDYDPSGVDISRNIEARLREFAPGADLSFKRIAVTREQIDTWQLLTRPTKQSDSRSAGFEGESVEVDAIPTRELHTLVRQAIEQHIDQRALRALQRTEDLERQTLQSLMVPKKKPQ